jgi:hypothetical protein
MQADLALQNSIAKILKKGNPEHIYQRPDNSPWKLPGLTNAQRAKANRNKPVRKWEPVKTARKNRKTRKTRKGSRKNRKTRKN